MAVNNNIILNKIIGGFKSIEWLAQKVHKLQDSILVPVIKKIWPRKITPNMITGLRIVLSLIVFCLILKDYFLYRISIIVLFSIAAFLDFIDGPIARALNKTSVLGAFLDPLSDKILICPVVLLMIWHFSKSLVILIVGLEAFAIFLASIAFSKKLGLKANLAGKWKMFFQVFGMIFIFFQYVNFGLNLLWISVGLAVASSLGYIQPAISYIFGQKNNA